LYISSISEESRFNIQYSHLVTAGHHIWTIKVCWPAMEMKGDWDYRWICRYDCSHGCPE